MLQVSHVVPYFLGWYDERKQEANDHIITFTMVPDDTQESGVRIQSLERQALSADTALANRQAAAAEGTALRAIVQYRLGVAGEEPVGMLRVHTYQHTVPEKNHNAISSFLLAMGTGG